MRILRFIRCQSGVVTVDWVVLLGALTVAGLLIFQILMETMAHQAASAADELQSPHFVSNWHVGPQLD